MTPFLRGLARAVIESFDLPGPVLEIGSYQVAGQEALGDLRGLLPGKPYVGVDMRPGPGVDCVADVEALPQADGSVGTVIAMSTFEHVPRFWRAFEEIRRVLRPDGVLLVSCPFSFHIHGFPSDYWRFTPAALEVLLDGYPRTILGWHGPPRRPINVWAVAFRAAYPAVTPAQVQRYRALMARYARQRPRWSRRLRYQVGRWLFGRGPFGPYLEQESWQIDCRGLAG
jgi:SAM-dependent methyltransferase